MIGWLIDTDVVAEVISQGGSSRVKAWASSHSEATLYLSILTADTRRVSPISPETIRVARPLWRSGTA